MACTHSRRIDTRTSFLLQWALPLTFPPEEATPFPPGTQFLLALSHSLQASFPLGLITQRWPGGAGKVDALMWDTEGFNFKHRLELTALWPWPNHMTEDD